MGTDRDSIEPRINPLVADGFPETRNAVQELVSQGLVEKVPERFGFYRLVNKKGEI